MAEAGPPPENAVMDQYNVSLTDTITTDLVYFSGKFIEKGFITRKVSSDILGMYGVGGSEKAENLLNKVVANLNITQDKKKWFRDFVAIFSVEAAYKPLADQMVQTYRSVQQPSPIQPQRDIVQQPSPIQPQRDIVQQPSPIQLPRDIVQQPSPIQPQRDIVQQPSPILLPRDVGQQSKESELNVDDDLLDVCGYLLNLGADQIDILGRILGLSHATVTDSRGADVTAYRNSIVKAWLLKQDKVSEKGVPSWLTLVKALRSPHLRQNGIADKIRDSRILSS